MDLAAELDALVNSPEQGAHAAYLAADVRCLLPALADPTRAAGAVAQLQKWADADGDGLRKRFAGAFLDKAKAALGGMQAEHAIARFGRSMKPGDAVPPVGSVAGRFKGRAPAHHPMPKVSGGWNGNPAPRIEADHTLHGRLSAPPPPAASAADAAHRSGARMAAVTAKHSFGLGVSAAAGAGAVAGAGAGLAVGHSKGSGLSEAQHKERSVAAHARWQKLKHPQAGVPMPSVGKAEGAGELEKGLGSLIGSGIDHVVGAFGRGAVRAAPAVARGTVRAARVVGRLPLGGVARVAAKGAVRGTAGAARLAGRGVALAARHPRAAAEIGLAGAAAYGLSRGSQDDESYAQKSFGGGALSKAGEDGSEQIRLPADEPQSVNAGGNFASRARAALGVQSHQTTNGQPGFVPTPGTVKTGDLSEADIKAKTDTDAQAKKAVSDAKTRWRRLKRVSGPQAMGKNYLGVLGAAVNPFGGGLQGYYDEHSAATRARHAAMRAARAASAPKPRVCATCGASQPAAPGMAKLFGDRHLPPPKHVNVWKCTSCGAENKMEMAKAYDGSKHNRDNRGRFTSGQTEDGYDVPITRPHRGFTVAGTLIGATAGAYRHSHRSLPEAALGGVIGGLSGAFHGGLIDLLRDHLFGKVRTGTKRIKHSPEDIRLLRAFHSYDGDLDDDEALFNHLNSVVNEDSGMGKSFDPSKHMRQHDGKFASKTGEISGRLALGAAGALGAGILAVRHGGALGGEIGRTVGMVASRIERGSLHAPADLAGMIREADRAGAGRKIGRQVGSSPHAIAAAGAAGGAAGYLAGAAGGAAIDRWRHRRAAVQAGKADQFDRLNARTSVVPTKVKQVRRMIEGNAAGAKRMAGS